MLNKSNNGRLPLRTPVLVNNFSPSVNGKAGIVTCRDNEYYTVLMPTVGYPVCCLKIENLTVIQEGQEHA